MHENKMGIKPVFPLLITMALPAMFSMFVQSMYNIVDSIFVAQIGQDALTAVSLAFPIQNFILAVAVGTGVGINSLIARRLGEGNREEANRVVSHGLLLAGASALLFVLFAVTCVRPFFRAYTSSPVIYDYSVRYTMIVTTLSFGTIIHIYVEKVIQATGKMTLPMIFQIIGCVVNIVLDPIFIFGLGPIPSMGIDGAAIATVTGQITSMLCAVGLLLFRTHDVKLSFHGFRFQWKIVKNIYAVGVPSILMTSVSSVLVMGLNAILISVHELAVSLLGIYFKLQSFVFMPVSGLTQGAMPIMGYNYGAKKRNRLTQAIRDSLILAAAIMAVGTIIFCIWPSQLLYLFNATPELLEIGVPALRLLSISFVFAACSLIFATLFQAVGKGGQSLLITLLRQLILILPVSYLTVNVLGMGLQSVWIAFIGAEAITSLACLFLYRRFYQKEIAPLPVGTGELSQ